MEGWARVDLGDVCEFRRGLTYKKSDEVASSSNAVLRANNIDVEMGELDLEDIRYISDGIEIPESKKIARDCLLVCTASGSKKHLGKIALIEDNLNYAFGGFMGLLIPSIAVVPRYLFWLTRSYLYADFISDLSDGVNINNLKWSQLSQFAIPLPPLPEQHRIVAILDEAFAAIAIANANAEKNLANAKELFESELSKIFTEKGEGWLEGKIGDICKLKSGTTVPKNIELAHGDIPYVKVADMNLSENKQGITTSTRFLRESDISLAKIFPVGTTIFPKRGGAIATNKKRLTKVPICADINIMGIIQGSDLISEFIYHYFLSFDLSSIGSGSSIPQINNYDIEPLVIHYPASKTTQFEIVGSLKHLSEESQRAASIYVKKLTLLTELKQSILHKAFTGELTANPKSIDRTLAGAGGV